jgi:hypothetical protein
MLLAIVIGVVGGYFLGVATVAGARYAAGEKLDSSVWKPWSS